MHVLRIIPLTFILLLQAPTAQAQQAANSPLPGIPQLMKEVHEHQKQLDKVRENYTFSVSQVTEEIDAKGKVSKTESREGEVFFVHGHEIWRTVKKDGKPLTDEEQKKEAEHVTKAVERAQNPQQEPPKESRSISLSHLLEVADVRNPHRENFRGRSTIVFEFAGKNDLKAHNLSEDLSKKLRGKVWVDEADRQVARLEATFDDNFHVAGGLVANVQKGSRFTFDQAQVNGEIWFPTGMDVSLQMRLLLFKGIHQHIVQRDYDYKRFHVEALQGKEVKVVVENKP